jgi:hypothetical protein
MLETNYLIYIEPSNIQYCSLQRFACNLIARFFLVNQTLLFGFF